MALPTTSRVHIATRSAIRMGELVAGKPALQLRATVSEPLELDAGLALLYRAVPGSGLDQWLVETRRALPADLVASLDLLQGFTGRRLYYLEEPILAFGPLEREPAATTVEALLAYLTEIPAIAFRDMAERAIGEAHADLNRPPLGPLADDLGAWRSALTPVLTTAVESDLLPLIADPERLKDRTIALFRDAWRLALRDDFEANRPVLERAVERASVVLDRGIGLAYAELTGHRLPGSLLSRLGEVEAITFCPFAHVGNFDSFLLRPPVLIVYFDGPRMLDRLRRPLPLDPEPAPPPLTARLSNELLVDALRAMAEPTRLRILDLLAERQLYAQEIVNQLGVGQSAVSQHLQKLERAGLVVVRPSKGAKYYDVDRAAVAAISAAIGERARSSGDDLAGSSTGDAPA